jgi:glutamate formiminotransferase
VPLLECVPNISEGRRQEVLAKLARAAARPGVRLLDFTSDPDHNRSVLTLAGEPEALEAALLALYAVAVAEIDLRCHEGVHPRVGAVDVVPFVPLADSTMADAVAAAQRLAAAVGTRFALPVYLYEQAASTAPRARRTLPQIRRGGFEGFAAKMAEPGWAPDFGPSHVHPSAGVTVIGARFFLIAFNVLLDSTDAVAARSIAKAVRESAGGLPAVRALGVWLASRGRTQVSINLLDYRRTSLRAVVERVREEAARRGIDVVETELVGLMPEDAAMQVVSETLALPRFASGRLLERRLADVDPA